MYKGFYLCDKHVYKWSDKGQYFLKMTGWESGEDRRKSEKDLNLLNLKSIKRVNALELINTYWNSVTKTWEYDGKVYSNECTADFPNLNKIPQHKFPHTYKDRNGNDCTYYNSYKIVWHQGKVYWMDCYQNYYPQVQLYICVDMDIEPDIPDYVKWTNIKNCKAITDVDTKSFI